MNARPINAAFGYHNTLKTVTHPMIAKAANTVTA